MVRQRKSLQQGENADQSRFAQLRATLSGVPRELQTGRAHLGMMALLAAGCAPSHADKIFSTVMGEGMTDNSARHAYTVQGLSHLKNETPSPPGTDALFTLEQSGWTATDISDELSLDGYNGDYPTSASNVMMVNLSGSFSSENGTCPYAISEDGAMVMPYDETGLGAELCGVARYGVDESSNLVPDTLLFYSTLLGVEGEEIGSTYFGKNGEGWLEAHGVALLTRNAGETWNEAHIDQSWKGLTHNGDEVPCTMSDGRTRQLNVIGSVQPHTISEDNLTVLTTSGNDPYDASNSGFSAVKIKYNLDGTTDNDGTIDNCTHIAGESDVEEGTIHAVNPMPGPITAEGEPTICWETFTSEYWLNGDWNFSLVCAPELSTDDPSTHIPIMTANEEHTAFNGWFDRDEGPCGTFYFRNGTSSDIWEMSIPEDDATFCGTISTEPGNENETGDDTGLDEENSPDIVNPANEEPRGCGGGNAALLVSPLLIAGAGLAQRRRERED